MTLKIIFWLCLGIIVYCYAGYILLLGLLNIPVSIFKKGKKETTESYPALSLLIASYNEIDYIDRKIANNKAIDYPAEKIKIIWITDGSDDGSYEKLINSGEQIVLHQDKREGKTRAINRGMKFVDTPYVVFTDANTMLNRSALKNIISKFNDSKTGCVSGEKRVRIRKSDNAVASGEGIYWKYESLIKRLESNIGSTVANAGELYAMRTGLFDPIPEGIINDDFYISLRVISKGYRIKYCPESYAVEEPSLNIREEKLRKVRIAAGGIQALSYSGALLNPFRYGFFSFQFFSHKVLRWIFSPFAFILALLINLILAVQNYPDTGIYFYLLAAQLIFWLLIIPGKLLQGRAIRLKLIFIPYYLYLVNASGIAGIIKYLSGKQDIAWEKSRRMI